MSILSVSYERLGDLAEEGGDVSAALRLYEQSLPIAEMLAAKDRTNAMFQNDVAITRQRIDELLGRLG